MKTQYYTASSLDGFIAATHNPLDWLLQFDMTDDYPDFIRDVGALAMGSSTYQWLLDDLSRSNVADPTPWPYNQPAWVFTTRTLPAVPNANIHFVQGDVRPVHEQMVAAANGKNIWLVGGGELVGQFYDHNLLDELIVTVASVTLAEGAPLLPRSIITPPLRLLAVKTYGEAFAQLHYEVQRQVNGKLGIENVNE